MRPAGAETQSDAPLGAATEVKARRPGAPTTPVGLSLPMFGGALELFAGEPVEREALPPTVVGGDRVRAAPVERKGEHEPHDQQLFELRVVGAGGDRAFEQA